MKNHENDSLSIKIEKPEIESAVTSKSRKISVNKESVKKYRITVRYIGVSPEEGKIKRAIIEDTMRKKSKP